MKFRKRPVVVDAVQWFKLGDHPAVRQLTYYNDGTPQLGYIDTLEGSLRVNPGDWIIAGVAGEHYACRPDIFYLTYEPAP